MDKELKIMKGIRRKSVDIFDLPTIVNLYHAENNSVGNTKILSTEKMPLTTDFGIPIFAYTIDQKLVAYSMVFLNESMENEYRLVQDDCYAQYIVAEHLVAHTKAYYEENGMDSKKLKNAIVGFVDWLNLAEKNRHSSNMIESH